jgi:hypothetical protein
MNLILKLSAIGDQPLFPELTPLTDGPATLTHVGILQAGMVSGKTSLALCVQGPDGRYWVAELSADMLRFLVAAVTGAERRWAEGNN